MQSPEEIKSRLFSLQNKGIKYDLARMSKAVALRGNPQNSYESIHVAGTNGKGSTCAYIESVLRRAGYKTGLYTSPHITNFEERFRIDGIDINEDTWFGVYKDQEEVINNLGLTFFEAATLMAFEIFSRAGVQYAVFETGMGGRLDATNIITPVVSVITKLALDHSEYLGSTLEAIAGEKLGIVKPGVPLVMLEPEDQRIKKLAIDKCEELGSDLIFVNINTDNIICDNDNGSGSGRVSFDYDNHRYDLSLFGAHQAQNALLALNAVKKIAESVNSFGGLKCQNSGLANAAINTVLRYARNDGHCEERSDEAIQISEYPIEITERILYDGLKSAALPGRFQVINVNNQQVVIDVGHNPDAMTVLVDTLKKRFPDKRVSFVLGMMKDKDIDTAVNILMPYASSFYFTRPKTERAADPKDIYMLTDGKFGGKCVVIDDVGEAVMTALRDVVNTVNTVNTINTDTVDTDTINTINTKDTIICVTGSFYTVSEAISFLKQTYSL